MPRPKSEKELALETQLAGLVKLREDANRNAYGVQMLLNNIVSKAPVWCDACDAPKRSKSECAACFPPKLPTIAEDIEAARLGIRSLHASCCAEAGTSLDYPMDEAGVAALAAIDRLDARLARIAWCRECKVEIDTEHAGGPYCCASCADS